MATPAKKPVPDGMHTLTPHLICAGAAAAIDYYKRAFGAVELMRMPGPDGRLMHAAVKIGDSTLMLFDEMPEWGALSPKSLPTSPVTIHLMVPDVDVVYARAVAAGGRATMPVADMFWGDRYGKLVDPFGHHWSIATRITDMTPEEMIAAGAAAMGPGCPEAEASSAATGNKPQVASAKPPASPKPARKAPGKPGRKVE